MDCCICLEQRILHCELPCHHKLCPSCMTQLPMNTCPLCRAVFDKEHLMRGLTSEFGELKQVLPSTNIPSTSVSTTVPSTPILNGMTNVTCSLAPCNFFKGPNGKYMGIGPMGYTGIRMGKNAVPDSMAYIIRMTVPDDDICTKNVAFLSNYLGTDECISVSRSTIYVYCVKDSDIFRKLMYLDLLDRNEYDLHEYDF